MKTYDVYSFHGDQGFVSRIEADWYEIFDKPGQIFTFHRNPSDPNKPSLCATVYGVHMILPGGVDTEKIESQLDKILDENSGQDMKKKKKHAPLDPNSTYNFDFDDFAKNILKDSLYPKTMFTQGQGHTHAAHITSSV